MYISWGHRIEYIAIQWNLHLLCVRICVNDYTTITSPNHIRLQVCNHKGVLQGTAHVAVCSRSCRSKIVALEWKFGWLTTPCSSSSLGMILVASGPLWVCWMRATEWVWGWMGFCLGVETPAKFFCLLLGFFGACFFLFLPFPIAQWCEGLEIRPGYQII